jgi:VanZ family protein
VTAARTGQAAFGAMVGISLVVLFSPASEVPTQFQVSDKLIHFLLFAALAVTGRLAGVPPARLVVGLVVYAGLSEILQTALPIDRDGDALDAIADSLGVLAGLGAVVLLLRRRI